MPLDIFQKERLLSGLCTFGIGGPARYYLEARTSEEMLLALKTCHKNQIPFLILGRGSNCLFDDRGFNGAVIHNKIDFIENPQPHLFHVGGGYNFSLLGTQTARQGWSGLEFASGIPGSVGGAVFMNAGANGKETCDSLIEVEFISDAGEHHLFKRDELAFAYRHSPFQSMSGAIISATFSLAPADGARQKQIEIIDYRKRTQPLKEMSAGCIFRNPHCGHAGALIEQAGLKGMTIGGAKVSEVHANFIVNAGKATSVDVLALITAIKGHVKEKTGIELESEVRFIPYER